jgi:hypothetical protein
MSPGASPSEAQRGGITPVALVVRTEAAREVVVECGPIRARGRDVAGVAELLQRLD